MSLIVYWKWEIHSVLTLWLSLAPSKHSRAARRAASPSLDLDKSLASAPRVEEPRQRDSVLADRANAGVMKKSSKPKAKTRAQKLRQQKGMERAEAVLDQMEIKVSKSLNRGKTVKARRVWHNNFPVYRESDSDIDYSRLSGKI